MGKNYAEYLENVGLAKEALILFMDGFFLQFFVYGYGVDIESIEDSQDAINEITSGPNRPKPGKMIASFNDYYYNVYFELPEAGYGGGSKFILRTAFCSTLPQLFRAFLAEGQDTISNFEAIRTKVNAFRPKIQKICRRKGDLEEEDESEMEEG